MISLLVDVRALGRRPSGVGMYIGNLVSELKHYDDLKFTLLTDVAESEEIKALEKDGIQIICYGKFIKKDFNLFKYYRFVQKCINDLKPDVFWEANGLCPIKMLNKSGLLYTTIHDMFPLTDSEHYSMVYKYYYKYGIGKTIRGFDRIIYNSNDSRINTEKYFPIAKEKKNFVGYMIVEGKKEIPISDNGAFLYVGNLETRKGTDLLLKAYQRYRKTGGNRSLRLAGKIRSDVINALLQETSESYGGVEYLGYITDEQKAEEYANCHCFVFPSKAEGFGIPVIEAMSYGKPVIAGNLSTLREVTDGCINLFDVNTPDADKNLSEILLKDTYTIDDQKYQEIVQRYSAKEIGSRYHDIICQDVSDLLKEKNINSRNEK